MVMKSITRVVDGTFDQVQSYWESRAAGKLLGIILVLCFFLTLALIGLKRNGLLPDIFSVYISDNYFSAILYSFTVLLIFEVVSLVLSLSLSVTTSVVKQFELLSLVLLRDAFKEISHYHTPFIWGEFQDSLFNIVVSAIAGIMIFIILSFHNKVHRHIPLTPIEEDRRSFIVAKKGIALILLFCFFYLIIDHSIVFIVSYRLENVFESFYTLLIFTDVLIILVSLWYGSSYRIALRNSCFSVATIVIRLALSAPVMIGAVMGVGGALFIFVTSFAYHYYTPSLYQVEKEKRLKDSNK